MIGSATKASVAGVNIGVVAVNMETVTAEHGRDGTMATIISRSTTATRGGLIMTTLITIMTTLITLRIMMIGRLHLMTGRLRLTIGRLQLILVPHTSFLFAWTLLFCASDLLCVCMVPVVVFLLCLFIRVLWEFTVTGMFGMAVTAVYMKKVKCHSSSIHRFFLDLLGPPGNSDKPGVMLLKQLCVSLFHAKYLRY